MPNNVSNQVTITGEQKEIEALVELMNGETPFDFSKIIPMPGEFKGVCTGGCTIDGKKVSLWWENTVNGESINVAIPNAQRVSWNRRYGADNWYDWSIKNWGTKWNAYNVTMERPSDNEVCYLFDTAWGDPRPVYDALGAKFPDLCIEVYCSGEVDSPYAYRV